MLGALLGGVSNIIGGLFGQSAAQRESDRQYDLARNSVSYRVEDAKRAGISPIYALGAPTLSSSFQVGDLGNSISSAGQNIGRAIDAQMSQPQRDAAFENSVKQLSLQKAGLENELLASQIRLINQPGHPPGLPVSGTLGGSNGPDFTAPMIGGQRANIDKNQSDAQVAENRWGNIVGDLFGIANVLGDARNAWYSSAAYKRLNSAMANFWQTTAPRRAILPPAYRNFTRGGR